MHYIVLFNKHYICTKIIVCKSIFQWLNLFYLDLSKKLLLVCSGFVITANFINN